MGELELHSAAGLSDDELAELFTAAYEGYLVPISLDAAAIRFLTTTYDLDREATQVAVRDGRRVGVANLGLRGADAWVGGIGVVPDARRQGVARALMHALHEQARSRGARRVWLEVIVENTHAHALYVQLGYEHVRFVEVWSLPGGDGRAEEASVDEAHAWIKDHRTEREPWQRADATLAKLEGAQGLMVDGAAAVVRVSGGRVSVVQLAGSTAALRQLLDGARSLGEGLSILNLPVGDPAADALVQLGGRVETRQHEMVLTL